MNTIEGSVPQSNTAAESADVLPNWCFWLGLLVAVVFGACLFRDSLFIGFLLDDFFHLDYLMKAFSGQPEVLYKLLWSNWSSDTTLTSYRPLVSFSLAADYALWNVNAFGYHLTNLLMFGGCIALVGLITSELTCAFLLENGRLAGLVSAVLFAAFPLHPEAVAWVIGRVDVLCTLLTLGSFYSYLLHRRTNAVKYLRCAVGTFLLALASKEMAVTLPVALTLFEWLAPTAPAGGRLRFRFSRALLFMWGALAVFAIWRTIILGTVVGGYGNSGWKTIKQGIKNFLDIPTLLKIAFGATEELPIPDILRTLSVLSYAVLLVCVVFLLRIKPRAWTLFLFMFGWMVVSMLPTFQIWHIWPNLVGSRLFFLGSVPFCSLIAIAAVGTVRGAHWAMPNCVIGAIAAATLAIVWSILLDMNLLPWKTAAVELDAARTQINSYLPQLSERSKLLVANLPQDFKGAPILGRPEYLAVILRPPFADKDYTPFVVCAEPTMAGGIEFTGPSRLRNAFQRTKFALVWNDKLNKFDQLEANSLPSALPSADPSFARLADTSVTPQIRLTPEEPLSIRDHLVWLKRVARARPILDFDCSHVTGAVSAKVYISKPWQPLTNAPRAAPPDKQTIERVTDSLPLRGSFLLPAGSKGVHEIAVMAFDRHNNPVGFLSEPVSAMLQQTE